MKGGRWRGRQHLNIIGLVVGDLCETPFATGSGKGTRIVVESVEDMDQNSLVVCARHKILGGREAIEATSWSIRFQA